MRYYFVLFYIFMNLTAPSVCFSLATRTFCNSASDSALKEKNSAAAIKKEKLAQHVVIVDDENSIRRLFSICLTRLFPNATIHSLENAEAGYSKIQELTQNKRSSFILLITDFDMPGGNGDSLVRAVEELKSAKLKQSESIHIYIIMVSGNIDAKKTPDLDFFLKKPVVLNELKDAAETGWAALHNKANLLPQNRLSEVVAFSL